MNTKTLYLNDLVSERQAVLGFLAQLGSGEITYISRLSVYGPKGDGKNSSYRSIHEEYIAGVSEPDMWDAALELRIAQEKSKLRMIDDEIRKLGT